ncbi:MAG: hypothetical protein SPF21_02985 [Candidatus Methanomethylophilaceae archaeon]|nr:hypothetical protein [Candidatus Methanomethylophilaceae archaeon]
MDKTKTIAVIAVIIIVIAAAAVVIVNGSSTSKEDVKIESSLRVFGNADGNYTIDNDDVAIIEDILKLSETDRAQKLVEYPLADANYDGKITEDDLTLVKKIVNDEPCTVYHYNTSNVQDYVVDTKWPIKSALATGAANNLWLLTMAGADDMVYGITYSASSSPDPTLFPRFSQMESIGSSSTKMPVDNASKWISQYKVTAIISDKTESTIDKATVEPQYEKMGVDIVRIGAAVVDVDDYCSQLFLIGFLFQTEDKCLDIAKWWKSLQNEIDSKLEGVQKVKVVSCNGSLTNSGMWVSAGVSDYKDLVVVAGGEYALDDKVLTKYTSGAYFKKTDSWLYNYDFDYIINIKTNDWYSGTVDDAAKYAECIDEFSETQAYQNKGGYVITGDAPIPVRIAYATCVMYGDIFSEDWADQKNKEFFEKFTDLDIDFSNLHFVISYDMAKGPN